MKDLYTIQKNIASALNGSTELNVELSSEQRLAIYRNSFTAALLSVLSNTYQVCRKIVGDDFFNAMALLYIQKTPSRVVNINEYGASFFEFIADFQPAQSLPYLSDVALLEWAWNKASCGPDWEPLDVSALNDIKEEHYSSIVFRLPQDSFLLSSEYPIHRIWEFNQEGYTEESTLDWDTGGVKLMIHRLDMHPIMHVLNEAEWSVLSAIQEGRCVGELFEYNTQLDLVDLFAHCMSHGWFTSFEVPT